MSTTYSFADTDVTFNHPDVGNHSFRDKGLGNVTVTYARENASHTATADGYVVTNIVAGDSGAVVLAVTQNSENDLFLRKYANYIKRCPVDRKVLATVTIRDNASKVTIQATDVILQRMPNRAIEAAAQLVAYPLMAAHSNEV